MKIIRGKIFYKFYACKLKLKLTITLLLYSVSNFFNAIFVAFVGDSFNNEKSAIETAFCTSATG